MREREREKGGKEVERERWGVEREDSSGASCLYATLQG